MKETGTDTGGVQDPAWYTAQALLDSALLKIEQGYVTLGLDEVVLGLRRLYDEHEPDVWEGSVLRACGEHPIADILAEDPFTRRCALKPRGYAGDAAALDFIFNPHPPPGTGVRGAEIFNYTTDGPAPRSVRARAAMVAEKIDRMAAVRPLRVLSVMGGHLWEARLSRAVHEKRVAKYVAFDQDAASLGVVEDAGFGEMISVYQGSVRSLLRGRSVFRNFDLVYCGLTDNLADPAARLLAASLFGALAPGGRLLLSNFAPDLVDVGYIEAFMYWRLEYRTEEDMRALALDLPADALAACDTYRDPHGNMVFLDVVRAE